jgi:hypothetical protein
MENQEPALQAPSLPQPRIFFSLPDKREVSYKDLFDGFLQENGIEDVESSFEESESENFSYPAFMQRIIERLDKYGQLALREQIGKHKSDPKKKRKVSEDIDNLIALPENPEEDSESSEDSCELYYDLSDHFIDDTDLVQNNPAEENDFQKSLNQGFSVISKEEAEKIFGKKNQKPQPKTPKKQKEKNETPKIEFQKKPETDIGHLDVAFKNALDELKVLYEAKRKEGNAAPFPKGTALILEKMLKSMEDKNVNYEGVFNNVSIISGQNIENVKNQFEKLKQKGQKSKVFNEYKKKLQVFKKKVQNVNADWNNELRTEFFEILDRLQRNVNFTNETLDANKGKKNAKPPLVYDDEEKKLIAELKKLNSKLENIDLKQEIIEPSRPIKSELFAEIPYNPHDFH